jgi:hypothetical protein
MEDQRVDFALRGSAISALTCVSVSSGRSDLGSREHGPNSIEIALGFLGLLAILAPDCGIGGIVGHARQQVLPLLEHPKGDPQHLFDLLRLTRQQR